MVKLQRKYFCREKYWTSPEHAEDIGWSGIQPETNALMEDQFAGKSIKCGDLCSCCGQRIVCPRCELKLGLRW